MKKILSLLFLVCCACVVRAQTGCTAWFTYTSTPGATPSFCTFTGYYDTCAGMAFYSWDFGDGTVLNNTISSLTHTYTNAGAYTVTMMANCAGCTATTQQTITIGGPAPSFNCANVNAAFTATNSANTFTFNNTTTNSNAIAVNVRYEWNYGDGSPLDTVTSLQTSHTYAAPGTYNARIIALYDSSGVIVCRDTAMQPMTVSPLFNCANVSTSFQAFNSLGNFTFMSSTSNTNTSTVIPYISYAWDFGDGGTDTLPWPNHTYTVAGIYVVTLTTTWTDSTTGAFLCQNIITDTLNVTLLPPNQIEASAMWLGTNLNAPSTSSVKFWLITYDSTSQMLTAVDSALVPCVPNSYSAYTLWSNVPAGDYRVKAHMINQPAGWTTGLLPTYADSAFSWQNATVLNHTNGSDVAYINFLQGIPLTGPGFIGGLVTQGANKGTAVGDPIPNLTIFLRDASNNPIASTETDASGNYSFSGVPIGSYSVYPEALNFTTAPSALLQITATTTNLTGNNFKYEPVMQTIHPTSLSVSNTATSEVRVFPNPAKDLLNIQFAQAPEKGAVIRLLNLNGQVVRSEAATQATMQQMNVSGLAAGTYLLQVPGTSTTYRIAVQK